MKVKAPCCPGTGSTLGVALLAAALLLSGTAAVGCSDATEPTDPSARYPTPTTTEHNDQIPYEEGTVDVQGPTPIQQVLDVEYPGEGRPDLVWYGFAPNSPYPMGEKSAFGEVCDTNFGNVVYEAKSLPKTIEGVVTIHPQMYQKISMCGEDHRYYGSYILQDKTGSITVLKDSRISHFTYGDRVRLRVLGVVKQFGRVMVLASDREEIVEEGGTVPYKTLEVGFDEHFETDGLCDTGFNVPEGFGDTYRIRGKVCQEPTDLNFNEIILQPTDEPCSTDPDTSWKVSLGLELGKRNFSFERGQVVTATGPVLGRVADFGACLWEFSLQAGRIGQLSRESSQ